MSILSNNFYYQPLQIDSVNTQVYGDFIAKEGDANGRGLLVTLTENGLQKDTTGITLNLKWAHTIVAGLQNLDPFEAVDLTKGLYKITYPTDMLRKGKVDAFIQIIDSGKLIGSRNIKINVEATVGDDTAIESSDEFRALASALVEVQSWNARIDDVEQEFKDKANNLDATYPTRLVSVETALEQTEQNLTSQLADTSAQVQSVDAAKMDKNTTDISVAQINKNKGKFDETYVADSLLQQITGGAPVNATPPNGGVTTPKIARKAVEVPQTTFLEYGKNLYNHDARTVGYSLDNSGALIINADYDVTDFIPVTAGLKYTLNNPRVVFFYDADRNVVGTKVDNSTHLALTVTPPAGVSYLRASIYKSYSPTFQAERGEAVTAFEPFKLRLDKIEVGKGNLGFKAVDNHHLEDNSVSAEKISIVSLGKNLFNVKKATDGFFLQETSGNLLANASFVTSDFIPVNSGKTYTISSARKFVRYDQNKVYVSGLNQTQAAYTFTAASDGYIRFSYSKDLANDVQMEIGSTVTTFEPYGFRIPDLIADRNDADALSGKALYSFGDSIMFGAGNGGVGIRDLIAQKYGMSGADYAISGASVAYYPDRSHIVAQIEKAIADGITPDYLIMNGGINDVTFNSLGEVSADYNYETSGYATFSAGLEYCFGLLKTTFPDVPLIYVWVHHMPSRIQSDQKAHHDRAVEICKKWSAPIVDMYESGGMNTMLNEHLEQFTYYPTENSGTHPNADGYNLYYVPAVVSELKRVAQ